MAKNKKDYTKFSAQTEVAPVETAVEEISEEVVEDTVELKPVVGVVANCSKLNVRKKPSLNSEAVATLDVGVEIGIALDESTKDFYKVYSPSAGVEGYCMSKYITIKP